MSAHDPILQAIQLRVERIFLFLIWSLFLAICIWLWVLLGYFSFDFHELLTITREGYQISGEHGKVLGLIFRGCLAIGTLSTSVMFLIAALWWRKNGDVHRRGAQFIDARGRS